MLHQTIHIATFNIHKGLTSFNAHFALHAQRELLRKTHADIVFLQEVRDEHVQHRQRFENWPDQGQVRFLADHVWPHYVYGKNAMYADGHHGNLILSKYPIQHSHHQDISAHGLEQRGMLHCMMALPQWQQPLHCICLHLGLLARWRKEQLEQIKAFVEAHVPVDAPLIIAGDFNDWRLQASRQFAERLHLKEVFEHTTGKPARSFPAWLPMLRMDRIYTRGFHIRQVQSHAGYHFAQLSDHAVLTATLTKD